MFTSRLVISNQSEYSVIKEDYHLASDTLHVHKVKDVMEIQNITIIF